MRTFIFIVSKYVARVTAHEHGPCWKHSRALTITAREHGRYRGAQFHLHVHKPCSRVVWIAL